MSKKQRKSLFLLGLSVTSFIPFLTILSADPDPQTPPPKEPEKPKEIAKDFDTFKDTTDKAIKDALKAAISNTIDKINSQINKLNEDSTISFEDRIKKLNYFQQITHFLESNQDKILQNPEQFGINAVFPKAISRNRKNNTGTITFQGKEYNDVIFGTDDNTQYNKLISDKDKIEIKKENEDNFVTKEQLDKIISDYSKKMLDSFSDFLFKEDSDIPPLTKDDLKQISIAQEPGFTIKPPTGFNTWDDYLESKLKDKYTQFDLEQNKPIEEENQQPQNPTAPDTPPPPIVDDNTKPIDDVDAPPAFKPVDFMLKVPTLKPEVRGKYIGRTMSEIISAFNKDTNKNEQEKSDEFFFFNNPINTRYQYTVTKIEENLNGSALFTVKITDLVKPEFTRSYKLSNITNDDKTEGFQYIYEKYIKDVQELFKKFYVAFGIGEKMEFEKINNSYLSTSIFTLLSSAVKVVYNENFLNDQSQIVSEYADKVDELDSPNINTPVRLLITQILSTLKNSEATIRNQVRVALFQLITATIEESTFGYDNALISIQKRLQNPQNKFALDSIKSKFEFYNQDVSIIEKLYNKTKKDVFLAKALASQKTFNYINWFEKFTNLIGIISKEFSLWQKLTTNDANASKYLKNEENQDSLPPSDNQPNNSTENTNEQPISQQADETTSESNNTETTNPTTNQTTGQNQEQLSPEEQATQNFALQIEEYKTIMRDEEKEKNPLMYTSGIIMAFLSLISLGFASFFRFFNKFLKHKTISKSMTMLIIFATIILILAIALIALGFTGGLI
ncbi:MSC_0620 family F1-like ATPase-associated subunit [Mycoplasma sp. 1654_15]|uniref:MSC_0620 family F1-like ATPase-associated subunit n=1 Tax=Mycoplasma sp. 1654_15 TaxID=2725994 RepID=UPI00144955CA|nr:hypothetical protein [Mycoplasma sp. 1654_15]QJB71545.1 hypothetical protein HF996_03765 [Mycoplasma sp. 1654_15]